MKLDFQVLENFLEMNRLSGNEVLYTAQLPDGTKRTVDMNMLFAEVYLALKALEHWTDSDLGSPRSARNNPTGQEAIGGR